MSIIVFGIVSTAIEVATAKAKSTAMLTVIGFGLGSVRVLVTIMVRAVAHVIVVSAIASVVSLARLCVRPCVTVFVILGKRKSGITSNSKCKRTRSEIRNCNRNRKCTSDLTIIVNTHRHRNGSSTFIGTQTPSSRRRRHRHIVLAGRCP